MRHDRSADQRPLSPLAALLVTLLGIAAMVGGGVLGGRLHIALRAQIAVGTILLALPAAAALAAAGPALRAAIGAHPPREREVALSALLGLTLWVGSIGLMEMQSVVMPPPASYLDMFRTLHAALAPSGVLDGLVSLAVIAVLPALCEELVVRGVLLPALAARMAAAAAVIASAALFAAMHGDAYRFLFTFTVGAVLGLLRLSSGSLWPPVVAHATLNGLTFLIAPQLDDPAQAYTPQPLLGIACLFAGTAAALPLLRRLNATGARSPARGTN